MILVFPSNGVDTKTSIYKSMFMEMNILLQHLIGHIKSHHYSMLLKQYNKTTYRLIKLIIVVATFHSSTVNLHRKCCKIASNGLLTCLPPYNWKALHYINKNISAPPMGIRTLLFLFAFWLRKKNGDGFFCFSS